MNKCEYIQAIKKVGYGYLIIMFDITIGTINIIPNWLGYILFYQSINVISQYEKSTELLKPLNIFVFIYELILWGFNIAAIGIDNYVVIVIKTAILLYFHFQLLTNIADIAKSHHSIHANRIYQLRNIDVIFTTLIGLPIHWEYFGIIVYALILIGFIIGAWICRIMFVYANEEKNLTYDIRKD